MDPPAKHFRGYENRAPPSHSYPSNESSRVLHVTGLDTNVIEADLLEAFSAYGAVNYAAVKKFRYVVGLVEFEEMESAVMCATACVSSAIFIAGNELVVTFSSLKEIPRHGFESTKPNHVLVFTVYNVTYLVNAKILKDICSPHGEVLRVAIVRKTDTFVALVEFASSEIAKAVKQNINGADIYSGCCTLKIEYANVDTVRITKSDKDHMDFTIPFDNIYDGGPGEPVYPSRGSNYGRDPVSSKQYFRDNCDHTISSYPPRDSPHEIFGNYRGGEYWHKSAHPPTYTREGPAFSHGSCSPPHARDSAVPIRHNASGFQIRTPDFPVPETGFHRKNDVYRARNADGSMIGGGEGCVIVVNGVDQQTMNCDKLFNIFCQYGNVLKILFMRNKPTTGMFEMGNPEQAHNLIMHLNGMELFGGTLEFKLSFKSSVKNVSNPLPLGDGTPSFRDYTYSRNHRFLNFSTAERNRVCSPQPALYWFNAPPEMDGEKITGMFEQSGAAKPINAHVFFSKTGKSATGTVEFATIKDAIDAVAFANHTPVKSVVGKIPFIVKVAFTASRGTGARRNDGGENQGHAPNFVAHFSREDTYFDKESFGDDSGIDNR